MLFILLTENMNISVPPRYSIASTPVSRHTSSSVPPGCVGLGCGRVGGRVGRGVVGVVPL